MGKKAKRRREGRSHLQPDPLEAIAAAARFDPPPGMMACKRCGELRSVDGPPGACVKCGGGSFVMALESFGLDD